MTPLRSRSLLAAALAALAAGTTHAAQGTIDLAWDQCDVSPATANRSFACNGDASTFYLVGMYTLTAPMTNNGAEGTLVVTFEGATVPSWWSVLGAGACRAGGADRVPTYLFSGCNVPVDPFGSLDGWALQDPGPLPNQTTLRFSWGSTAYSTLTTGVPYIAFAGAIRTVNTVSGACPGCDTRACIELRSINTYGTGGGLLTEPGTRTVVTWQGGVPAICPGATPVSSNTWGAVKQLYR